MHGSGPGDTEADILVELVFGVVALGPTNAESL